MDGIILKEIAVDKNRVEFHYEVKGKLKEYFNTDVLFIDYDTSCS